MEKYHEELLSAVKNMKIADHIVYITYPVIKDKRLLLKAVDSAYETVSSTINSIIYYDSKWKKLKLPEYKKDWLKIFSDQISLRMGISSEDMAEINELCSLSEKHKNSAIEFTRQTNIVIMSDNLKTSILDLEKAKKYLNLSKRLIERAKKYMGLA